VWVPRVISDRIKGAEKSAEPRGPASIRPCATMGPKLRYDELLLRARKQVDVLDGESADREELGRRSGWLHGLEQTVKLLPYAPEAPEKEKRDPMLRLAESMGKDARSLKTAASEVSKLTGAEQTKKNEGCRRGAFEPDEEHSHPVEGQLTVEP